MALALVALLALQAAADAQTAGATAAGSRFAPDWNTIQTSPQAHPALQITRILVTIVLGIFTVKGALGAAIAWHSIGDQRGGFPGSLKSPFAHLGLVGRRARETFRAFLFLFTRPRPRAKNPGQP